MGYRQDARNFVSSPVISGRFVKGDISFFGIVDGC